MKVRKFIPVIFAGCAAAAIFGGCTTTDESTKYDELNAKLDLNYSQIVLTVTNTYNEKTVLTDEYTMKFVEGVVTVNYSIERFTEISLDSATTEKTTIVGEAVIVGSDVIYIDGEKVSLDAITSGTGLDFKKEYFSNDDLTDSYLKADVTNPSGFMGTLLNGTSMKVNATFGDAFNDIKITYHSQNGYEVEYLYTFTV